MKWFITAALFSLALLPLICVFAAMVWFANEWVVSGLASVTLLIWLCGWLVIAYGRGRVQAAAIGAVVAGAAYWLLALGPWFQTNIGSTLLTSRLLTWVEATQRQPVLIQQVNAVYTMLDLNTGAYVANNTIITGSGSAIQPQYVVTAIPQPPPPPPAMSHFQSAGHWSFAWLFALAGGALAALLRRNDCRGAKTQKDKP